MRRILRAALECAKIGGFRLSECRGETLRALFAGAERAGATVYWGAWSEAELDQRIGR